MTIAAQMIRLLDTHGPMTRAQLMRELGCAEYELREAVVLASFEGRLWERDVVIRKRRAVLYGVLAEGDDGT